MKKKISKLLVSAMAMAMCFSSVACGGTGGGNSDNSASSGNVNESLGVKNPYEISVFNFGGGYGREWLDTVVARYKAERAGKEFVVDGVTYDGVEFNIESEKTMMTVIAQNNVPYDIVFQEQVLYNKYVKQGNVFSPMTEVLTTENPYEKGTTIESKLSEEQKAFYKIDTDNDGVGDTYYGIPHYTGYVGIVYNKHLFAENGWYFQKGYNKEDLEDAPNLCFTSDASQRTAGPDGQYGTDDDGLPTTYEEFYALCSYISVNKSPISWAGRYRQEYLNWFITALSASYEGLEQMSLNYSYDGTAKNLVSVDASGKVSSLGDTKIDGSTNGYELSKQAGKYYALSFLETIADENWYTAGSIEDTKEQTATQREFIIDEASAMMIEGCWWEMEADSHFNQAQQLSGEDYRDRFGWMPLPCATEAQAETRATTMKNGGNGYTLMDTHNSLAFLGKNISSAAKEIAIDFLQFAYTDKSLAEFSEITDTTKAVKYTMSDSQKANMSAYGRSLVEMQENSDIVYGYSQNAFYQLNEENFTDYKSMYSSRYTANTAIVKVAFDEFRKGKSAKEYFDGLYNYQLDLWNSGAIIK